jgi:Peptidase family M23.
MKIYSPTHLHWIGQGFGVENTVPSLLAFYQSLGLKGHDGLDFQVNCVNTQLIHGGQCDQVFANVEGDGDLTVSYIQKDDVKGWGIIATDQLWNKFLWWHFDIINPDVVVGKILKPGDLLGVSGDTGYSTGAHCHFAYYKYGEDYQNGYHGACDPMPFYTPRFICDVEKQIGIIKMLIDLYTKIISLWK